MSSPTGRACRIAVAFAFIFALAAPTLAQSGSIGGLVRDASATPVVGIGVHLQPPGCCWSDVAFTTTQADGGYAFTGLADGSYIVRVDSDPMGDLLGEYFADVDQADVDLATVITIAGGSSRGDVDFTLAPCASVSGALTGVPAGETVNVQLQDALTGRWRGSTAATGSGTYTVACVAGGTYRAMVDPWSSSVAFQYYAGQTRWNRATSFTVAADADVVGIDFTLEAAGAISGSVSLNPVPPDPSAILQRMSVTAIDAATFEHVWSRNVNPDGSYAIPNLPPGTYIIEAQTGDTNYVREVWSSTATDTDDYSRATPLVVTGGATISARDFVLEAGRQISGHLFLDMNGDGAQQPGEPDISGASVSANLITGAYWAGTGSNASGEYVLYGLRPGVYQVQIESSWSDVLFVAERWNGHSMFSGTYDAVDVSTADRTGADFSLVTGTIVSGSVWIDLDGDNVVDAGEPPLTNGTVRFSRWNGGCCVHAPLRSDGTFRIHLAPDLYSAEAWDNSGTLLREYWNNAFFGGAATAVDARAAEVTGISFGLVPALSVGPLQGVVTGGSPAAPIPGVDVHVQFADGGGVASAVTDGGGRFFFSNLPPATYRVLFQTQRTNAQHDTNYSTAYWDDGGGNQLFVFPAAAGSGTDLGTFTLPAGASISGTIYPPAGDSLPAGLTVSAYSLSETPPQSAADVAADGSYRIRGLPAGAYKVQVGTGPDYIQVLYLNGSESTWDNNLATAVQVSDTDVPGIDLFLIRGGSITGTVTDGTGTPVGGVPVSAGAIGFGYGSGATTNPDGTYSIARLISGSYEVRTDARSGPFANQYYPSSVLVSAPAPTPGINFTLSESGTIRGRVTHLVAGTPAAVVNLRLQATDYDSGRWYSDARTDPNGDYAIGALPRGARYRVSTAVQDDPVQFPFVSEYYDNAYAHTDAAPVTVPEATGEATGIDFALEDGARIEGTITLAPAPGDLPGTYARMWVDVNTAGTFQHVSSTGVRADGTFAFANLAPGSYVIQVNTGDTGYVREVWASDLQDVYLWSSATPIAVAPGEVAAGRNLTLEYGRRISGHVFLDANDNGAQDAGEPDVAGASMYASSLDGSFGQGASTDASGDFVIYGLRGGTYQVTAEAGSTGAGFVAERWNAHAVLDGVYDTVDVTAGDASGITFSVQAGHEVSGRVCQDVNANGACDAGEPPITNTTVRARRFADNSCCAHTWPLADGTYRIHLAAGAYRLEAFGQGSLLGEFWNNQAFQEDADALNVAGATAGVDFSLIDGTTYGTLRGRVVNEGGAGIPDVDVGLFKFASSQGWGVSGTRTDADGYFLFSMLPAGDYRIYFNTEVTNSAHDTDVVGAYWSRPVPPGVIDPEAMRIVFPEDAGGTDLGSFTLATGGSISGTVHLPVGDPGPFAVNLQVQSESFESGGSSVNATVTSDGTYRLRGLPAPATYRIQTSSGNADYVRMYYHSATQSTWDYNLAQAVQLTAAGHAQLVDLYLEIGGSISGQVVDEVGNPLAGIPINASRHDAGFWGNTQTASDGTYRLRGMVSGDYTVRTDSRTGPYGNVRYPGSVTVTAPGDSPGIDFTVTPAGVIRGRVTQMVDGVEVPVVNIRVQADDYTQGGFVSDARTDINGDYAIGALARGRQYRVAVVTWDYSDPQFFNFVSETWNDRRSWEPADPVPADPGGLQAETTGIAFLVALGGAISGIVTEDVGGAPITGLKVQAHNWATGEYVNGDYTDQNGFYILRGIPPGQYRVQTYVESLNYISEYYDNTTSHDLATPVTVAATTPETPVPVTQHIDFGMEAGRVVTGRVTDALTFEPIGDIQININGINVSQGAGTRTLSDGTFSVQGLVPGRFTVNVDTSGTNYAVARTTIDTTSGDVADVNFALRPGARLGGYAYLDQNANLVLDAGEERANVGVSLYDYVTGQSVAGVQTDTAGRFQFSGLSPGQVRMQTESGGHNFVRLYYNNTLSQNAAAAIVVNEGDDRGGFDFRLVAGHQIAGLVFYDANGDGIRQPEEPAVPNVNVNANRSDGQYGIGGRTRADGTYTIYSLLPGLYRVQVNAQGTPYASEYFKSVGGMPVGTNRRSLADLVDLSGGDLAGVDFPLALGGSMTGTLREDGTGTPLSGISVNVNNYAGDGFGFGATTDATGRYLVSGLPADTYRVYASDPAGVFVSEYYQDKQFSNDATSIAVPARSAPDDPLAIVADMNLARGATIEGVVYHDLNGDGIHQGDEPAIAGVRIWANEFAATNRSIQSATTSSAGTYRIGGLPTGLQLKVQANPYPLDFIPVWYDGGDDRGNWNSSAATAIVLTGGEIRTGISFALAPGGALFGSVRDGNGAPLGGINVNANVMVGSGPGAGTNSDAAGQFALHGIATGTYRVWAGNTASPNGQEYFDNQRDSNAASPIALVAGTTRTDVHFVLPLQPLISGPPSITGAERGSTVTFTLAATRLAGPQCAATPVPPCSRVELGGGGIIIQSSSLDTATGIFTVQILIAPDAPVGMRTLSVVNDFTLEDAAAVRTDGFEVRPRAVGDTPATGGERLYVADSAVSQIQVYRTADHTLVQTIDVCCQPSALALSPEGNFLYVSGLGDRSIGVVDTRLGREVGRVQVDGNNGYYAVAATSRFLFVVDRTLNDRVRVIDAKTWMVVGQIVIGANAAPYALRADPLGRWVFVANTLLANVSVIDANPAAGLPSIVSTVPLPAGTQPRGIAFTPDGSRAYVVAATNTYLVDTALAANPATADTSLIDTDGDGSNGLTPVPTRGGGSGNITIAPWPGSPGTVFAYIAVAGNRIWVVDVTTDRPRIVRDLIAGYVPRDLRTTADGSKLFVTHTGSKDDYVIDTANLVLNQPQIPVSMARFASSPGVAGTAAVGPIPPAPPAAAPAISSIAVQGGGPARNGAPITVTLTGDNFDPAPIVWLAGTMVRGTVTAGGSSSLTVDLPAQTPAGEFDVVVTNLRDTGNLSGVSSSRLTILPPEGFSPTQPVYVTSYGASGLTVLQPDGGRDFIATQPFPGGLSITPEGKLAVVPHMYAGPQYSGSIWPANYYDVSLVDLTSGSATFREVVATIPYTFTTFNNPAVVPTLEYLLGNMYVYVPSGSWVDMVAVIDPATRSEIDLDANPLTQSIEAGDADVGQFASKLPGLNRIELDGFATDGNMVIQQSALTPDGALLYVSAQGYPGDPIYPMAPAQVTIVDTGTNQVVGALKYAGAGDLTNAQALAVSPTRLPDPDNPGSWLTFVYVVARLASNDFALVVYRAYDTNDHTAFVDAIVLPEMTRNITVSLDGRTVYVAARAAGELIAIDVTPLPGGGIAGTTNRVTGLPGINGLAVAPDDGLLYVAQVFRAQVLVFNISADPLAPQFVTSLGVACPTNIAVQPTAGRPRVARISPTAAPPEGGTSVVITGANFGLGASVDFGTAAATNVVVENAYTISATVPAGTGVVDVKVTNTDEQFDILAGRYRYEADTTPPVFTTPPYVFLQTLVGGPGSETADVTIRWRTDEPSSSRVDYGIGSPSATVTDPALVTEHQVVLTALSTGTTYVFRAASADTRGNVGEAPVAPATASFLTPTAPDVTAPVVTVLPTVAVTTTSATIQWTTNEVSTSLLQYDAQIDGVLTRQASGAGGTSHSVTLTGLVPNTEYEYRALSSDSSGNGPAAAPATAQPPARFHTAALPDTTPPAILTGPSVSYLSRDLVIVTWTTDEPGSSFVNYGVASINEQGIVDLDRVTTHIVFLTNLAPGTTYGFQAGSTDASGNTVLTADPFAAMLLSSALGTRKLASAEKTGGVTLMAGTMLTTMAAALDFTTPQAPDQTPPVVTVPAAVTVLAHDRVLITVGTDEAASLFAAYAAGTTAGEVFDPVFDTAHSVVLAGLDGAQTYSLRLTLTDPKGNAAQVSGLSFTTPAAPDVTPPIVVNGPSVSSITQTSAIVAWTTDEPADGSVRFAPGGSPFAVLVESGLRLTHEVHLTGLLPGTEYHFDVSSRDASANEVMKAGVPFTTGFLPPVVGSITPDRLVQGRQRDLVITGARFDANASLQAGAGISVSSVVVNGAGTAIAATVVVGATAPTGPRTLTILNPRSGLTAGASVTVVDDTVPVVTIVDPVAGSEVTTRSITVRGTISEPAQVTVNGVAATIGSGPSPVFEALITLETTGLNRIVATATDSSGNRGAALTSVNLTDAGPPALELSVTPAELWPANHELVPVMVTVSVADDTDPAPIVELLSVTSSEPDDAAGGGDGGTTEDIQGASIGTDDREVWLRAERQGSGPGRVYILTYRATDRAGNSIRRTVEVRVPHDRR